jgi:Tfp pilus assembly protein PilF
MYTTQALWFVVPVAIDWLTPLSAPQTRYSSGMLAVMHSAQYLWITRYFARRDAEQAAGASGWHPWAYAATLVAGGMALFLPVPWLASYGLHVDFTTSVLIVAAIVNIHHFMVDGVVWKLRNPRVGRVLVEGAGSGASDPTPPAAEPLPGRRGTTWAWRIAAVAGLVALAAIDQVRYVLAIGHDDTGKLTSAARLNPYDSATYVRLAQAETTAGRTDGAIEALRRAIAANPDNPSAARALILRLIESDRLLDAHGEALAFLQRFPDDVDMLVNAGVLEYRLGNAEGAERWWRRAAARDPSQPRIHLYLAERLDARGETHEALGYYRRYLELIVQAPAQAADRPAPGEVVAVVVKYGDALAKDGQRDLARTQYELAMKMATQTGLTDLGTLAEAQRRALDAPAASP